MAPAPVPEEREEPPQQKKEGQLLGCIFATVGVGFIFLCLFAFLRGCA
jgi:hypothetical protein